VDWDKIVQLLVNGMTLGSVYALVALGFSMIYGILKLLNLAHGDVLMVAPSSGGASSAGSEAPRIRAWRSGC